jgi:hypothetical protein
MAISRTRKEAIMTIHFSWHFKALILSLSLISFFSACKSKQPSKAPAADINEEKKTACNGSNGNWAGTYCKCNSGFHQDPAAPTRCLVDEKPGPGTCTGDKHWDAARADCVANTETNPTDLSQTKTARECFDRSGWWNGTVCSTTVPITQQDCQKTGDQWASNVCTRIDPNNKSASCHAGRGTWSDAGCACESGSVYDQIYFRCVTANPGGGGNGPGQYPPQQACEFGNGHWNGSYCTCPAGTQYDQNAGRCWPNRGYTPYCPGQFDSRGYCYSISGEQMLFNLLYGWALQSLFLDDPNRPEGAMPEEPGDGH